jgi:hypothetical protein
MEHDEQVAFIQWSQYSLRKHPELESLYAIPNGGLRNIRVAQKLKAEGVKPGVPDLHLPVARGQHHSLYIEMKYGRGKQTAYQKLRQKILEEHGNKVVVCYSCDEAIEMTINYLNLGRTEPTNIKLICSRI